MLLQNERAFRRLRVLPAQTKAHSPEKTVRFLCFMFQMSILPVLSALKNWLLVSV